MTPIDRSRRLTFKSDRRGEVALAAVTAALTLALLLLFAAVAG